MKILRILPVLLVLTAACEVAEPTAPAPGSESRLNTGYVGSGHTTPDTTKTPSTSGS